jgi:hypothetical protein
MTKYQVVISVNAACNDEISSCNDLITTNNEQDTGSHIPKQQGMKATVFTSIRMRFQLAVITRKLF